MERRDRGLIPEGLRPRRGQLLAMHRHCEVYGILSLLYLLEQPFVGRLRRKMANFSLARLVGINPAGKAQHFTRRDVLFRRLRHCRRACPLLVLW